MFAGYGTRNLNVYSMHILILINPVIYIYSLHILGINVKGSHNVLNQCGLEYGLFLSSMSIFKLPFENMG